MCFRLALYILLPSYFSCSVVEAVSSNIDEALILQSSANIMVCGDFNAHTTDFAGLFCQEFVWHKTSPDCRFPYSHVISSAMSF